MAEPNPTMVIADCIEKSKATTDQELIGEYIAETLGVLQTDNTEEDTFNMLGSAIVDAVADDPVRTEALFEVWSELEEQRKLSYTNRNAAGGVTMKLPQTGVANAAKSGTRSARPLSPSTPVIVGIANG
jgi:hypothetical protein